MNLLLHGLDFPADRSRQLLPLKLTDIGERDRLDVILTIRPSAARKRKVSRAISLKKSKPPKLPAIPCSSSCASCGV